MQLVADDGRNIVISQATGGDLTAVDTGIRGLAANPEEVTQIGSVTLRSKDGSEITITGDQDLEAVSGFQRGTFSGNTAQATSEVRAAAAGPAGNKLQSGDLVINGVSIGGAKASDDTASFTGQNSSVKEGSAIAVAAAINKVSDATGVTAVVNANVVRGTMATAAATASEDTQLNVNGVLTSVITSTGDLDRDRAAAVKAINEVSGQSGVVALDKGDGIELVAADGRNITVLAANNAGTEVVNGTLR